MTGEIHVRHPDFYIIAAANTWGTGATAAYCGRNKLDDATLDRFVGAKIRVDYDAKIERAIARSYLDSADAKLLLDWVGKVRRAIEKNRLQRVASTRMIEAGCKMLSGDDPDAWTDVQSDLLSGWTEAEVAKVDAA
jgi:cobaltochelatase CobS